LLDRQVGGLLALEGRSGVNAGLATARSEARSIADQAAGLGVFTKVVDRRNDMSCRQRDYLFAPAVEERIGAEDERTRM
jgi:hypothetical protein